jgi:short-subunit dehydrogenase
MSLLTSVASSNNKISTTFSHGLVAVFVGGTSGVGEYTVKAFAKYSINSRVYIVGRSRESADRIIQECSHVSSGSTFQFIQADVSALRGVNSVCDEIKNKETTINLLFLSQGSMGFNKSKIYF